MAQTTNLPPISVEANTAKPKAPAKAPQQPQPGAAAAAPAPTPEQKSANPYANPNAPYNVERSASGKFTEPLVNTPRTVTTIPKEVLQDKAATTLRELVRTTPGITLGTGEGGNNFGDRIFIRGFDARNDVYVDGVRDIGVGNRETFAVEQVEIYKGPSGIINGRGSPGGAVNIISKMPNEKYNFYNLSTTFGTDNTKRVTVDVNQIVSPELTIRANGMLHGSNVAGRDVVEDNRWGGSIAATYKPSGATKLTVDYYHLSRDGYPDYGVPFNSVVQKPVTEAGVDRNNWYGIKGRDFNKNEADIVTGHLETKLSGQVTLSTKLRRGSTLTDYVVSAPEGPNLTTGTVNANAKSRYQENDVFTGQSDLTFKFTTAGLHHTLVAGVERAQESIYRGSYVVSPTGVSLNIYDPNNDVPWTGTITRSTNPARIEVSTAAAYLIDTVKIGPRWILSGGVRLEHYDVSARDNTNSFGREDNLADWNAGITYKLLPNASVYVAYSTSSAPTGAEVDAGLGSPDYGGITAASQVLGPERARSAEVGTKWELFDRRMLATAALFRTEKYNAREQVPGGTAWVSGGEYRVQGVELGVAGNITDKWSVFGGLVVFDSEVLSSIDPTRVGKRLANVAHTTFSLLSKYRLTDSLTVGGQASYASEIYGGTMFQLTNAHIPEHWRFDALAEYKFTKHFSAQLNVLNLTNVVYYDAIYRSATPFAHIAPGRAAYLTLNWKY
ncbi:MAG: TonB-dependent siderophore receptor [Hyphomicrobiaceae bacterium]|nr:TonB-dependent siderophore receptor [Hyphomicrobiaceae bacterium]